MLPHHCSSKEARAGTQTGRNVDAGADAETMEGTAYLLASCGTFNLLSYRTQDHQPRDGTTHNRLGPPPSVTN